MAVALLTGCNQKSDIKTDLEKIGGDIAEDEAIDTDVIKDVYSSTVLSTSGNSSCNITYTVEIPDTDITSLPIYTVQKSTIDSDYIEKIVTGIFDGGDYVEIKPDVLCTVEERADIKAFVEEELYEKAKLTNPNLKLSAYTEGWLSWIEHRMNSEPREDYEKDGLIYKWTYDLSATDDEVLASSAENTYLIGTIDGEYYMFERQKTYYTYKDAPYDTKLNYNTFDFNKMFTENNDPVAFVISDESGAKIYTYGENKTDKEAAIKTANKIIDRIGYGDMKLNNVYSLCKQDSVYNSYSDGYFFDYERKFKDIPGWFSNNILAVDINTYPDSSIYYMEDCFAEQEYIIIEADNEGVQKITLNLLYENFECMEQNAKLLSFDKIDNAIQKHFKDGLDAYELSGEDSLRADMPEDFNEYRVILRYVTVKYGDEYALVPAWVYTWKYENVVYGHVCFNAIDGSKIALYQSNLVILEN